jgi:hypothetical protein
MNAIVPSTQMNCIIIFLNNQCTNGSYLPEGAKNDPDQKNRSKFYI